MRELYKEGRIVGPSSYELYVRQRALENSYNNVILEQEYLAILMSSSCSMILKVPAGTTAGYHDYVLPENSKLCGCTFVKAFMLEGQVNLDGSNTWATSIINYGRLVSNTSSLNPDTPGLPDDIPTEADTTTITDDLYIRYRNYLKITGGRIFQPGQWVKVSEEVTCKQLYPNLDQVGFIRIAVSDPVDCDLTIMLTGFSNREYLAPIISQVYAVPTNNAADSDFLGPIHYPWACPIEFLMTNIQLLRWKRYVEAKMQLLDERSLYLMTFHLMDQEEGEQ